MEATEGPQRRTREWPHVDARRSATREGSSAMAVDAVTASAELTPREKLRTGNTVPSEVAYMTHAHMMQHTEDVGAFTADGKYAAHIWPEPDRHPACYRGAHQ